MSDHLSLMELGRSFHAGERTLEDVLCCMTGGSCSVLLNWPEDDRDLWECSWIVGGKRYTGMNADIRAAVLMAIVGCTLDLVNRKEATTT